MNQNEISYQIKKGDYLYELAKKYNVHVDDILKINPNINPHNLVIGSYIKIPYMNQNIGSETLKEKMRSVWEQHVYWTRLVIISIVDHLSDEQEMTERLLINAKDFANLFKPYYGANVANIIEKLMTEHLLIASQLVHAVVNRQNKEAEELNRKWYQNADAIAESLSSINPYYNKEALRHMLYEHLDLTKEEAVNRMNRNYQKEIDIFDNIEKQALMMADYFTEGIIRQFK